MAKEIIIQNSKPLPKDYVFVMKGDAYITRNCLSQTRKSGRNIFIVQDGNTRIGVGVPRVCFNLAKKQAAKTEQQRADGRASKLAKEHAEATEALERLYPNFPYPAKDMLRAWDVGSGRVGRTTKLSLDQKVALAVTAVARHQATNYDSLLRSGVDREEARKQVWAQIKRVTDEWRGKRSTPSKVVTKASSNSRATTSKVIKASKKTTKKPAIAKTTAQRPTPRKQATKKARPTKSPASAPAPALLPIPPLSSPTKSILKQTSTTATRPLSPVSFASVLRGLAMIGSIVTSPTRGSNQVPHLKSPFQADGRQTSPVGISARPAKIQNRTRESHPQRLDYSNLGELASHIHKTGSSPPKRVKFSRKRHYQEPPVPAWKRKKAQTQKEKEEQHPAQTTKRRTRK